MTPSKAAAASSRADRLALVAFLDGRRVGHVHQTAHGTYRFTYEDSWRNRRDAYPLSLAMPLSAAEHRHDATAPFLWGLLPDNQLTLDQYGRLFGVSPGNPASLLAHIGADCAGAVQFAPPESADELESTSVGRATIEWLTEADVAHELKTVREQGVPGMDRRTVGQFSLAGAQPKIALFEQNGRWGRPVGRTPTNRILKPPAAAFKGFAENEHFCLELASHLGIGSVTTRVQRFEDEIAIVVERFDRVSHGRTWQRIHQEDVCQALSVMPTGKYETEGGPGIAAIVTLIREYSLNAHEDIERFLRACVVNWVIAATDAHAKNFALLHGPRGGVRLAPFYDMASMLPYSDRRLYRVKLAMKVGTKYLVRDITRKSWESLAKSIGVAVSYMTTNVAFILDELPAALSLAADRATHNGLDENFISNLAAGISARVKECRALFSL